MSIEVDNAVPPKFCKARPVPYALKRKVDEELDRLIKKELIQPVTNSRWAAAIVPVLKPDQSVRICGDYKLTVNKAARLDTYPIPKLEDLFSRLPRGAIFTKLDEESKQFTVINTHRGLFAYNRLSFGISSAPGIFQRAMEGLLQGIPGVLCYLDDVLVSGSSESEHQERLYRVLQIMQDNMLKLEIEKCLIGVPQVSYLGYLIDKDGMHPTDTKVKAIIDAPAPRDITQLKSYLELLNFY